MDSLTWLIGENLEVNGDSRATLLLLVVLLVFVGGAAAIGALHRKSRRAAERALAERDRMTLKFRHS